MIPPPLHNQQNQTPEPEPGIKQQAFLRLYEPAHASLSRYCHAILRNREDARDLISETLLTAYENFENLRNPRAFLSFLFGIAAKHIQRKQRRKKFWGIFDSGKAENINDTSSQPEAAADLRILYDALATLPIAQREALVLFEISGLQLEEIREIMGGSLSGVKSNLGRARKKLAQKLGVHEEHATKPLAAKETEPAKIMADNSTRQMPFTGLATGTVPVTLSFQKSGK